MTGDTDRENGLVDTAREREGRKTGECSIDIYTLPCIKQIANRNLLHSTECCLVSVMT